MYISDFNYFRPKSIKEATTLLENSDDGAPIAGGTDLLVEIKQGLRHHEDIISLTDIEELKIISEVPEGIFLGAGLTHNELISSTIIINKLPAIAQAASKIGCDQVRNKGTIGGNICTAASCCDLGPVLLTLNASVELASSVETRTVPLIDFFVFHRKTTIKKGELVTRIFVPHPEPYTGVYFEKFGLREAAAVSVASVAVMVKLHEGVCDDACIVIGAVAPTPKISNRSIDHIVGKDISLLSEDSQILMQAGNAAAEDAIPIDDIRGGANYRRDLIKVLTRRAIVKAIDLAQLNHEDK
ncbi:MAG TPA: xanthine dehydrogenase family protein subunit M [Bacteroidales bacterium]|jgi:carbon-monoxide dehydrogenase medium subunit|nr:xanthine dehydrogenase family protein subunit M [Bacteroidales bacterium]